MDSTCGSSNWDRWTISSITRRRGLPRDSHRGPGLGRAAALRAAEEDGRRVTHALLSHHHHDHVNGLEDVLAHGGIRVHAHRADVPKLAPGLQREVTPLDAGDVVEVGPLRVSAMHTPGHTPGSTCWHAGEGLFAGDTVFVNACGRCDFAGGDPEQMFESLNRVAGCRATCGSIRATITETCRSPPSRASANGIPTSRS